MCHTHLHLQAECGHHLCDADLVSCHLDEQPVCPVCSEACAICGRYHCEEHGVVCRRCGQVYCRACVHWSGLCAACGTLDQEATPVKVDHEVWATDARVREIVPHYRWRRVSNERYQIFVGDSSFFSRTVIVVRRTPAGGHVVAVRRLGADDRLRDLFGDD
jgi:hypothetical protein